MQTQAPVPPPPPAITTTGPGGAPQAIQIPLTRQEISALRDRREELSNQLISAADRRKRLSDQLVGKEGADRAGLEARIGVLDQRIVQLETDIAETGRQLTAAPAALLGGSRPSMDPGPSDMPAILGGLFTIFVLGPLAVAFAVRLVKRGARQPVPALSGESAQRLERLESSVDAIAVEVERISEGQRFVTRLLSQQGAPALAERSQGSAADRS